MYFAIYRRWARQETAAMRQGDRPTSLISAGPPCQADVRKLFIPKLKWDTASYHSHRTQKTNDIWSLWQRLNNKTGLTWACMGSSIQSPNFYSYGNLSILLHIYFIFFKDKRVL